MATEEFIAELQAAWEACGPWVPESGLTDDGRLVRAVFLKLMTDGRLRDCPTTDIGAIVETYAQRHGSRL